MHFSAVDINYVYKNLCKALTTRGRYITTRGLVTKEITNVQVELQNPTLRFITSLTRNMDMNYFIGELCFYLDGRYDLNSIAHYSKFWEKLSDDNNTVNSAYGYRLFKERNFTGNKQLSYIIQTLIDDQYSRKAVIPIYSKDDGRISKDNPCTMFMQFLIREDKLDCYVTMRSNDIWLGFPYDVAFFTILQEIVLIALQHIYPELRLGYYYHNVTSMHVYERNFESLYSIANETEMSSRLVPSITITDYASWFNDLITYEKATRNKVLYKAEDYATPFQTWCKDWLR